jgi:hypothetical protein
MLSLIGAGLGAGLSLLGEMQRKGYQDDLIKKQTKLLKEAKIDSREEAGIESNINRNFNTHSMNSMNKAAVGLSSVLNSDTMRGLNSSVLLGQRASALAESKMKIMDVNRQLDTQIAGIPSAEPINAGNLLAGGFLGFQIGESLDKLTEKEDEETTEEGNQKINPFGFKPPSVSFQFNPSLGKLSLRKNKSLG